MQSELQGLKVEETEGFYVAPPKSVTEHEIFKHGKNQTIPVFNEQEVYKFQCNYYHHRAPYLEPSVRNKHLTLLLCNRYFFRLRKMTDGSMSSERANELFS